MAEQNYIFGSQKNTQWKQSSGVSGQRFFDCKVRCTRKSGRTTLENTVESRAQKWEFCFLCDGLFRASFESSVFREESGNRAWGHFLVFFFFSPKPLQSCKKNAWESFSQSFVVRAGIERKAGKPQKIGHRQTSIDASLGLDCRFCWHSSTLKREVRPAEASVSPILAAQP